MDRADMLADCVRSAVSQLITTNAQGRSAFGEKAEITTSDNGDESTIRVEAEDGGVFKITIAELEE